MAKSSQKTGAHHHPHPGDFKAKAVNYRKVPAAFGKSGQADNQSTSNRNRK